MSGHRPIHPPGLIFNIEDNRHVDTSPAILRRVDPTKLTLALQGMDRQTYTYVWAATKGINWGNPHWIKRVNNWRSQHLRRLHLVSRERRHPWIQIEHDSLLTLVRAELQQKQYRNSVDWVGITNQLNAIHQNQEQAADEPLAISETMTRGKVTRSRGGKLRDCLSKSRTTGRLGSARSVGAVKAQAKKFPAVKAILDVAPSGRGSSKLRTTAREEESSSESESDELVDVRSLSPSSPGYKRGPSRRRDHDDPPVREVVRT